MFRIPASRRVLPSPQPIISDNYRVLHSYDDLPILFVGTNAYDSWIIGSSVEENRKGDVERFFHVPVTYPQYVSFITGRDTYRKVITSSDSVFVLDRYADSERRSTQYLLKPADIPEKYLPSEDSFCPPAKQQSTFAYIAKLTGGTSDRHSARPADLSPLQVLCGKIIESAFETFSSTLGTAIAELRPATTGSYELNFHVEFVDIPAQLSLFGPIDRSIYSDFANDFLQYCLNKLPSDLPSIAAAVKSGTHQVYEPIVSAEFEKLFETFHGLKPSDESKKNLLNLVSGASSDLKDIAATMGESYKSIGIANRSADANTRELPLNLLGIVDESFKNSLESATDLAAAKTGAVIYEDQTPQRYTIVVYQLNTNTGVGYAMVKDDPPNSKTWSKPRIVIEQTAPLVKTDYSLSLYEGREVTVMGLAKRVDNKMRQIRIVGIASEP